MRWGLGNNGCLLWPKHRAGGEGDVEDGKRKGPAHGGPLCHVEFDFVLSQWEFFGGVGHSSEAESLENAGDQDD